MKDWDQTLEFTAAIALLIGVLSLVLNREWILRSIPPGKFRKVTGLIKSSDIKSIPFWGNHNFMEDMRQEKQVFEYQVEYRVESKTHKIKFAPDDFELEANNPLSIGSEIRLSVRNSDPSDAIVIQSAPFGILFGAGLVGVAGLLFLVSQIT